MMKVLSKNSGKVFLIIVICGGVSVFYKLTFGHELPCIYLNIGDALPAVENIKYSPKPNSIFFHETSCRGGLTSRQACAVESAARANSEKIIYVLFSAAVSEFTLSSSNLANLKLFRNIRLARVHLDKYAENTPLEETMRNMHFDKSKWRADYISHVLRSITLYKYGGIHLDTDIIMTKSLASLGSNWVAKEDDIFINSAAIAISTNFLGQKLAVLYMKFCSELKKQYKSDLWPHNGPGPITRVLSKLCATYDALNWPSESCEGLKVYTPKHLFPVHYNRSIIYFQPGKLSEIKKNAYAHHFWNKLTYNMSIDKNSPLMELAKQSCPTIFKLYGDHFGLVSI